MSDKKPFVMVDGSSYLFRAFHALPPLRNERGQPTGAVYGVTNMLLKLLREYEPEHIAILFDARGKTFRDELFDQYKAQRPPMPDDLAVQIEPLHAIVQALGLPLLQIPGVEADDVIGTLTTRARAEGFDCVISTIDKDMAQLVQTGVTLVNTMYDSTLDRDGVRAKFGIEPEQMVDYLALVGDTSDNIPGVPGVGKKTAEALLSQFVSMDGIYAQLEKVPETKIRGAKKLAEKLEANREQAYLSRELATIRCDVELDRSPADLNRTEPDTEKLRELYTELGFGSLLRQLSGGQAEAAGTNAAATEAAGKKAGAQQPVAAETDYETVLDKVSFDAWLKKLDAAELIAFDTETTSLDYMKAEIVGVSFAVERGSAAYVPVAHRYAGAPDQLERDWVLEQLKPTLENEDKAKVGHHLKYDAHVLLNHGIELRGMRFDTMLESYVLDSTATRHDMDSVALKYLQRETIHYEDVAGKGAKQICFDQVPLEQAAPYAAEDADITLQLHDALWERLSANESLRTLYREIEQPLVPVLTRMEHQGVLIDVEMLRKYSGELAIRMKELEETAYTEAGTRFNLGSPKQLQEVLFEMQGLPVIRKTPKGQPSTAEDVLAELAEDYPLPRIILEYRSLSKLRSTYAENLPKQVNEATGRVHTSYHQAVAATGRLSSSDPNLQNIPIRTMEGRKIRQAFIAPDGWRLLAADYSQIELRIMAHLSGDEGLLQAFREGRDVHQATAAEVFGVELDEVTSDHRRSAKAINFGLIYGMSAFGLARQLNISRSAAAEYVNRYFERYPGVKEFMDHTREQARETGFVETVYGRRLYLPEINSRNGARRQYAERSAINAPMQGTAADVIKRAMLIVDDWLSSSGIAARLLMQVHDELVLEVEGSVLDEVSAKVCELMSSAAELAVPLTVDAGTGMNWDEAH